MEEDGKVVGLKVRYQEELSRNCLRGHCLRIANTESWPSATREEDKGLFPSSLALAGQVSSASSLQSCLPPGSAMCCGKAKAQRDGLTGGPRRPHSTPTHMGGGGQTGLCTPSQAGSISIVRPSRIAVKPWGSLFDTPILVGQEKNSSLLILLSKMGTPA